MIFLVQTFIIAVFNLCFTKTKKASIEDYTNFEEEILIDEFYSY